MKAKRISLIGIICILCCTVLLLTSCSAEKASGVADAQINENGELILIYEDGTEQNLGAVVGKDGSLVIDNAENGVSAAVSKGLRSAVSIVCNFKTGSSQWRPSAGREYSSAGSGVIYQLDKSSGDAFIITNYHVVYDSSSSTANGISDDINVYIYGNTSENGKIKATYVGGSLYYDIAILRIEDSEVLKSSEATQIDVCNSDTISVGDIAIAIGNAEGYGISASSGIVSVDSEYITMTASDGRTNVTFRVIRVDAAVNSGNSGGGLYNGRGELIGIVNAKIVDDGVENIGYAIPSNVALSIADNIIDYCYNTNEERVKRALIGVAVEATNSKAIYNSETGRISINETVAISEISKGSLADGIFEVGDVLVSATFKGEKTNITRQYHIIDMMLNVRASDTVDFEILRNGQKNNVKITITEDCLTAY